MTDHTLDTLTTRKPNALLSHELCSLHHGLISHLIASLTQHEDLIPYSRSHWSPSLFLLLFCSAHSSIALSSISFFSFLSLHSPLLAHHYFGYYQRSVEGCVLFL